MTTTAPPYFDAEAIRGALPIGDLLDAVESAYRDVSSGRDRSPVRAHAGLGPGTLLTMPGIREGGAGATVKLVTVMPDNPASGLPTIHALVAWFDAASGRPLAFFDGAAITAMRTGAASGVGTRLLARTDAETLGVIGAGAQAEWQIRAVLAARPIRRVLVAARDRARLDDFVGRVGGALEVTVEAAEVEAAIRAADVVCCATTSTAPVFDADWLRPGTHVNGIGAFRLDMVELPAGLFERAAVVAIDAREASMAEAGDVVAAIRAGVIDEGSLVEIGTVSPDWVAGRDPEAITVFKSVGLAIQDVAAVEVAAARLLGPASG